MGNLKLSDLSPEEYDKLMKQAKERVEAEASESAAIAIYKAKKKEFMNDQIESIVEDIMRHQLCLTVDQDYRKQMCYASFKAQISSRYTSLLNFFMRIWMNGVNSPGSTYITKPVEWAYCEAIGQELADFMVAKCVGDGFAHDEMEYDTTVQGGQENNG